MRTFIFFLWILLLCSCQKETDVPTISIDTNKKEIADISKYFNKREVVFLETTDQSLLGGISKIIRFENVIYILDKIGNRVVAFDKNGKYLADIHSSGRGPQEYRQLSSFTINEKARELIIHADRPGKLLIYDLDCRFKYEQPYTTQSTDMVFDNDQLILSNLSCDQNEPLFTFLKSKNGTKPEIHTSSFKINISSECYTTGTIVLKSERISFARRFENTIYSLDKEEVVPRYQLDFGKQNLPEYLKSKSSDNEEFWNEIKNNRYIFSIADIKETPHRIIFRTNQAGIFILNKDSLQANYVSYFKDKELGLTSLGFFVSVEEASNKMICFENSMTILNIVLENQKDGVSTWFIDKVKSMSEDENPVLTFYSSNE